MLDEAVFTAADLMTRDVIVVHPETSLRDAVKLMADRQISGMPVVDDTGTIIGMLGARDLIRWHEGYTEQQTHWLDTLADGFALASEFLQEILDQHRKVKSVMSAGPVTMVTEDTLARDIAHLMYTHSIRRVLVMRDGKIVGIVALSDLVRALAQKL